jgi:chemotaxis protein MotB
MADDAPHEIVIVRRRHDDDHDAPHGGVWKVAFADFMTAMMAFFLVLWIVNSTNKETRASLARYFNPVQLSDTTPARKGLQDPRQEDFDASAKEAKATPQKAPATSEASKKDAAGAAAAQDAPTSHDEAALFRDPARALEQIAATEPRTAQTRAGETAGQAEAYRDPFEPMQPPAPDLAKASQTSAKVDRDRAPAPNSVEAKLKSIVEQATFGPALDVTETREGTLIDLTDRAGFGMFASGSAEPDAALVRMLASIGATLKPMKGRVVIRGFTDGRPFHSPAYDNWRLSAARAQMAFYMLRRGGLDEARVERIEGYGDHGLRDAAHPEAAGNRRIEILIRRDAP